MIVEIIKCRDIDKITKQHRSYPLTTAREVRGKTLVIKGLKSKRDSKTVSNREIVWPRDNIINKQTVT